MEKMINVYTMRNGSGSCVRLTNLGARIMSVVVPDREGVLEDVVLGFADPRDYLNDRCYLGATIGPVANRISGAQFALDGQTYTLDANDGANSNHGGFHGIDKHVFRCLSADDNRVVFDTQTADGVGGFPAGVHLSVAYTFDDNNFLRIDYRATATRKTVLNLTNHAYFNLSAGRRSALESLLKIGSSHIAASDASYIPTGKIVATRNTRHDFSTLTAIGKEYNDYYILDRNNDEHTATTGDEPAATLIDKESGRVVDLYTSYPGVFFYSADFLSSDTPGIHGRQYAPFDGICLEAQLYPDAVNQANFPSIELPADSEYSHYIGFHFRLRF